MPVLDTSFLIDLERRKPAAVSALQKMAGLQLMVPFQAALELIVGLESPAAGLRGIQTNFSLAFPDEATLLEAARIFTDASASGMQPPWSDLHVAATAMLEGTYLLTAEAEAFRNWGCKVWDYRREDEPPNEAD